jgi:hypothetical protein
VGWIRVVQRRLCSVTRGDCVFHASR